MKNLELFIRNASEVPIYEQLASQIKQHILTGNLSPGEALPSLRVLAKELRISVITTKRAYEELEAEGYLQSVAGKGSFVAQKSTQLLREEQLRVAEQALAEAVSIAHASKIPLAELQEMLETLYRGD